MFLFVHLCVLNQNISICDFSEMVLEKELYNFCTQESKHYEDIN